MVKPPSGTFVGRSDSTVYMGIDPGKAGGIVVLYGKQVETYPMPGTVHDVGAIFKKWGRNLDCKAVIEKVSASPQMGVTSAFTFGNGFGWLQMALDMADIKVEELTPQVWMKGLNIPPRKKDMSDGEWKKSLRGRAQKLYPFLPCWMWKNIGLQLCVTDALLIATYCKQRG